MSHSPLYFDLSRKGIKSNRCFSSSEMVLSLSTGFLGASSSSFFSPNPIIGITAAAPSAPQYSAASKANPPRKSHLCLLDISALLWFA